MFYSFLRISYRFFVDQIRNPIAYVRDYYFFKRSQYPQLELVHMEPDKAFHALQKQELVHKFVESGKVLLTWAILKNVDMVSKNLIANIIISKSLLGRPKSRFPSRRTNETPIFPAQSSRIGPRSLQKRTSRKRTSGSRRSTQIHVGTSDSQNVRSDGGQFCILWRHSFVCERIKWRSYFTF